MIVYIYFRPSNKEYAFQLVMNGRMRELIQSWGRTEYLTPEIYDLLSRMLQKEEKRITMTQIKRHSWLQ